MIFVSNGCEQFVVDSSVMSVVSDLIQPSVTYVV
jgi:hypothetical protein